MNTIGQRIEELMKEKHISIRQLQDASGINRGTLSKYIKGQTKPKSINIHKIAEALGVDEQWLMGMSDHRRAVKTSEIKWQPIPVFSCLSCGTGTWVDEKPNEFIGVPDYMMFSGSAFANPAEGDSMEPGIHNGDLLIFQETPEIESGFIGSFRLNGSYYCKRFKRLTDGSCWLFSDNTEYEPIPIKEEDSFQVLGKYKMKLSKEQ